MEDVIKNLNTLFDVAWEENMNGRGTDITRMVTTFVPGAIQDLQAYKCGECIVAGTYENVKGLEKTGMIGTFEGIPLISVPALIEWLLEEKYTNVNETSDDMTEEFEREHQWELSRNCFINEVIKHL